MDALCRWDYQAASQYCTWKLLETTWKCFVSFWMASAIESLSLLSSLSRCNQNWTHTIMHHAFKTWCIVSTNGRYAISNRHFVRFDGFLLLFRNIKFTSIWRWGEFGVNALIFFVFLSCRHDAGSLFYACFCGFCRHTDSSNRIVWNSDCRKEN